MSFLGRVRRTTLDAMEDGSRGAGSDSASARPIIRSQAYHVERVEGPEPPLIGDDRELWDAFVAIADRAGWPVLRAGRASHATGCPRRSPLDADVFEGQPDQESRQHGAERLGGIISTDIDHLGEGDLVAEGDHTAAKGNS